MAAFLLSRLISALLVILGVSCLVFLLIHIVPGDPVEVMLGESSLPADRETLRHALGLDLPLLEQLANYFSGLFQFDLGTSLHSRKPILDLIIERVPATVELAFAGLMVALIIAFPLGILAAVRKDTPWDGGAMMFSLLGISIPNFWMGPILILLFSLWLGWLPVSGKNGIDSLILPALTLGTAMAAILSRMIRASLLEVLGEDFIRTAYAKGLNPHRVIFYHALPNAMLPVITLIGLQFGTLLAGAVITEIVFSWPGIGSLTIDAINRRDYPVLQAAVLLITVTYVVINTLTDLVYAWLDPRIRLEKAA
ncbi:MAG: nickel ABC transporter permease [Gammaproteobacteria bacterium]